MVEIKDEKHSVISVCARIILILAPIIFLPIESTFANGNEFWRNAVLIFYIAMILSCKKRAYSIAPHKVITENIKNHS